MKPRAKAKTPARGGLLDLGLVLLVVFSAWTRTPLGGLGAWAHAMVTGEEAERPSLIATFVTAPLPEVIARIEAIAGPLLPVGEPGGPFPEPYRSAARLSLPAEVPEASRHLLATLAAEAPGPLDVLDHLHAGDPEATLEIYAIGEELRARAMQRARAAGEPDPAPYAVHRRYLPAEAARRADAVVTGTLGVAAMLGLTWPIAGEARISSPYGWRTHPTLGTRKLHNGVDIAVPVGTPVLAAQRGEVSVSKEDALNGRYVVIDHGHGVRTSYCHLDQLDVAAGDEVEGGDPIGLSGNTGRSTGPHLHFTLRVGRETVDPERFRPPDDRS